VICSRELLHCSGQIGCEGEGRHVEFLADALYAVELLRLGLSWSKWRNDRVVEKLFVGNDGGQVGEGEGW